jgi:hypothetical protein
MWSSKLVFKGVGLAAKKLLPPAILAVVLIFVSPLLGVLNGALEWHPLTHPVFEKTVIYTSEESSIAFKS